MALNDLLARIGTSAPVEPFLSLQPLIDSFSFSAFARATPKFSETELRCLNTKILHESTFYDIQSYLTAWPEMTPQLWDVLKKNIEAFSDLEVWMKILKGDFEVDFSPEDQDFLNEALTYLPTEGWDNDPWSSWQATLKERTPRRGKTLLKPLRRALTGLDQGPELAKLIKLLGQDQVRMRLRAVRN